MIDLTESAIKRIESMIEPGYCLRIAVLAGGCSGYYYNLTFVPQESATEEDLKINFPNFKVLIDSKSLDLLIGTNIDYIEEAFGSSFKFTNPNSTRCCGCGESFSC